MTDLLAKAIMEVQTLQNHANIARLLLQALKDLHMCHRAFSSNDNWTSLDDRARAAAENAIDVAEAIGVKNWRT